jgi:two-component system, NarL family, nitrate/nitrite response regulator NarL
MINILIADDHKMVIDGLKALLSEEKNIKVIGQALSGNEVIRFLKQNSDQVDLIILDINMPDTDGIETAKHVHHQYPRIKILILSMYNRPLFIKNLIEAGVSGYILKNTGKEELLSAISKITNGEDYFSAEITKSIMTSFKEVHLATEAQLTKREQEILRLLAKALTTSEIAEQLFLSTHTIDTHRKNLLSKLNLKNTPALVKYAIENGFTDSKF